MCLINGAICEQSPCFVCAVCTMNCLPIFCHEVFRNLHGHTQRIVHTEYTQDEIVTVNTISVVRTKVPVSSVYEVG